MLYGGKIFACRRCHGLAYPSQNESASDRTARRADSIRAKLGWDAGILNGDSPKPKGMHWRTFERLLDEHDACADLSCAYMMDELYRTSGKVQRQP